MQKEFKYKEVASWAATKTNFAFVTGDLKVQKKYVFKTDQVAATVHRPRMPTSTL